MNIIIHTVMNVFEPVEVFNYLYDSSFKLIEVEQLTPGPTPGPFIVYQKFINQYDPTGNIQASTGYRFKYDRNELVLDSYETIEYNFSVPAVSIKDIRKLNSELFSIPFIQHGTDFTPQQYHRYEWSEERKAWILRQKTNWHISTFDKQKNAIYPFPNPTSDYVSFTLETDKILRFELFEGNGSRIISQDYSQTKIIDLSKLLPGVYYYRLFDEDDEIESGRIVKK